MKRLRDEGDKTKATKGRVPIAAFDMTMFFSLPIRGYDSYVTPM